MKLTKRNIRNKIGRDRIARMIREARNSEFVTLHDPLFEVFPNIRCERVKIIGIYTTGTPGFRHAFIQREYSTKNMHIIVRGENVDVEYF